MRVRKVVILVLVGVFAVQYSLNHTWLYRYLMYGLLL